MKGIPPALTVSYVVFSHSSLYKRMGVIFSDFVILIITTPTALFQVNKYAII